jgi:transcriptional regulator with XRE-family HTH domain
MKPKNTEFSKEVKLIISEKLQKALEKEQLTTGEAAELLKVKPVYISMIRNPKHIDKASLGVFERLQKWCGTGETIRKFGEKFATGLEFIGKAPGKPEEKEEKSKNKTLKDIWDRYKLQSEAGEVTSLDSWLDISMKYFKNVSKAEAKKYIMKMLTGLNSQYTTDKSKQDAADLSRQGTTGREDEKKSPDMYILAYLENSYTQLKCHPTAAKLKETASELLKSNEKISEVQLFEARHISTLKLVVTEIAVEK